jgi:hypothetical protein
MGHAVWIISYGCSRFAVAEQGCISSVEYSGSDVVERSLHGAGSSPAEQEDAAFYKPTGLGQVGEHQSDTAFDTTNNTLVSRAHRGFSLAAAL